jgi:hypothetical protein
MLAHRIRRQQRKDTGPRLPLLGGGFRFSRMLLGKDRCGKAEDERERKLTRLVMLNPESG